MNIQGPIPSSSAVVPPLPMDEEMQEKKKRIPVDVFQGVKNAPIVLPFSGTKGFAPVAAEEQYCGAVLMEQQDLTEDSLFFVQLPSHLPLVPPKQTTVSSADGKKEAEKKKKVSTSVLDEDNIWTQQFESTLTKVPTGYIGELLVHRSGKTKLKLGNVQFDVVMGTDTTFLEQVASIDLEKQQACILGSINKRLMCIPDVENLFDNMK